MPRPLSKKDIDILEERGYWQASSSLYKKVKQLTRKKLPLRIGLIKHAHQIIFETAEQPDIAGKYRRDNPEVKRIDGTLLEISHWHNIISPDTWCRWGIFRKVKRPSCNRIHACLLQRFRIYMLQ